LWAWFYPLKDGADETMTMADGNSIKAAEAYLEIACRSRGAAVYGNICNVIVCSFSAAVGCSELPREWH
jgi:site-specific recombinase